MREIYYGDFREMVIRHYREIAAGAPEFQSTEWFLLRYLKRIGNAADMPVTPGRLENSMRGFIRFYVDQIDERTELGRTCISIYEEYRKTLRRSQQRQPG